MPKLTDDCIQQLNQAVPLTETLTLSPKYHNEYNCPFCGSEHHVKIYSDTNTAHCVHCGESFNGIQALQEQKGEDFLTICREIAADKYITLEYEDGSTEIPGIETKTARQSAHTAKKQPIDDHFTVNNGKSPETANMASEDDAPENTAGKYTEFVNRGLKNLYDPIGSDALDYLYQRGLSDDVIIKYEVGYYENEIYFHDAGCKMPAIIFPHDTDNSYYSARSLTDKHFSKPKQSEAGKQTLYNPDALYDKQPCWIVEGEIDALSVIQAGGNACALCGVSGKNILINKVKAMPPDCVLILAMDNDEPDKNGKMAGQDTQADIAAKLDELKIPYINACYDLDKYPQGMSLKDANDLLRADAAQFSADVKRIEIEAKRRLKPDNVTDFIRNQMHVEIMDIIRDSGRGTGFDNIDVKLGGLYNGLYCIGGLSAVGKTTFVWQMADQLAKQGYHVLFFSLEMSKLEMITKSISRYTVLENEKNAATSTDIKRGKKRGRFIEQAAKKYMRDVGDRISVIQGDFNFDVSDIDSYTNDYIKHNNATPVIIVDYLQILPGAADLDTGRKSTDPRVITNENVLYLKRISRKYKTPVIVTAALNRENYLTPIDYSSFRESSAIEYSCDFLAGLQLNAIHDDVFDKKEQIIKKREHLEEAKNKIPREIEFIVLKNRWGKSFKSLFDYYQPYDIFKISASDIPSKKEIGEWRHITDAEQMQLPFDDT